MRNINKIVGGVSIGSVFAIGAFTGYKIHSCIMKKVITGMTYAYPEAIESYKSTRKEKK